MERNGLAALRGRERRRPARAPRYYTLTPLGRAVLTIVSDKVGELRHETHDGPVARTSVWPPPGDGPPDAAPDRPVFLAP